MDLADPQRREDSSGEEATTAPTSPISPRKLPDDLPTSLDDRCTFPSYGGETEMYDAWQGVRMLPKAMSRDNSNEVLYA